MQKKYQRMSQNAIYIENYVKISYKKIYHFYNNFIFFCDKCKKHKAEFENTTAKAPTR